MTGAAIYLRTADIPLDDLAEYPGNAKRGDVDAIRASLRRNGQYRSLVVRDADGALVILAGHHTRDALAAEGHTTARCEVITCDDDTARTINLADNHIPELGGFDDDALAALLAAAQDANDLDGTGYDNGDLDELLRVTGQLADETNDFLAPFIAATPAGEPASPATPPPVSNPFPAPGAPQTRPAAAAADTEDTGPDSSGHPDTDTAADPADNADTGTDTSGPPPNPVHTGPDPYQGPGAPAPAGEPPALPDAPQLVPVQWVVTVDQRTAIRAALKRAQRTHDLDNASAALATIASHYLDTVVEPAA
ncbi:ParB N-terminal domain-containing protein [Streptomyces sp. NBC_00669]|uniref:ParB/RepB/Spo0J family partition protein n=1 Tax=Streptomyces sp. NBC_00669 TaxID=2976011 RepID=UPI002E3361D9|nr:ParB/RepB/Spo0J family partition protein [Streptomyces sp. NBC_00669]